MRQVSCFRPAISCGQVVAYKKGLETVEVSEEIEEIATDLLENLEPVTHFFPHEAFSGNQVLTE